jgi:hypothetical protein
VGKILLPVTISTTAWGGLRAMPNAAEMTWNDIQALVAELAIQSKETDEAYGPAIPAEVSS